MIVLLNRLRSKAALIIACVVAICLLGLSSIALSGCQNAVFTISLYEKGESVPNGEQDIRIAKLISLDKVNYSYDEKSQTFNEVTGIISLNATVLPNENIDTVEYAITQPNVTLCVPEKDYSSDMNMVTSRGKSQLVFNERRNIQYASVGIIIQPQEELNAEQGNTREEKLTYALINYLDNDFLTVTVTYDSGVCVARSYTLSAEIDKSSGSNVVIFVQQSPLL